MSQELSDSGTPGLSEQVGGIHTCGGLDMKLPDIK